MRYFLAERLKDNRRSRTLVLEAFFTGSVMAGVLVVLVVLAGYLLLIPAR
jgi:hypothetical protein